MLKFRSFKLFAMVAALAVPMAISADGGGPGEGDGNQGEPIRLCFELSCKEAKTERLVCEFERPIPCPPRPGS